MSALEIGSLIFLVAMLLFLLPRMKSAIQNSRKGSSAEWLNVAMIFAAVAIFVFILVKLV